MIGSLWNSVHGEQLPWVYIWLGFQVINDVNCRPHGHFGPFLWP